MLKSGGPMMTITYVFTNAEQPKSGNNERFQDRRLRLNGNIINEDSKRMMRASFKSSMLMYADGTHLLPQREMMMTMRLVNHIPGKLLHPQQLYL